MRLISLAVILSVLASGSAAAAEPRRLTAATPIQQNEAETWRKVAEAIPLGSKVKIQTLENKRISGTLMRVDNTTVTLKRNTRRPEAATAVNFEDIAKMERDHGGGVNIGKAIAIGAATGAAAMITLILFAMQLD
jgi:hypothetical protein